MSETDNTILVRRLLTAFELFEAGWEMRRQQLRRQHPAASEHEIRRHLQRWLESSSSAEDVPAGFVRSNRFL